MQVIGEAGQFTRPAGPFGTHWVEQFRVPALSVGTYSIPEGGTDDQIPHTEDEIYVVTSGRAALESGGRSVPVGPGTVVFVPAGEEHRFTDVTQDLAALVLFAPAEGTHELSWAVRYVDDHVTLFNEAVALGDFSTLLARFSDDAVVRFENVPGAGTLEFAGRDAYTAAYARQPPDDQIELTAPAREEEGDAVAEFVWRRDRSPGVMRLTVTDGRTVRMVVSFG